MRRRRRVSLTILLSALGVVPLSASVEPVVYSVGSYVERLAADSGRQRSVRTHLGDVEAIVFDRRGELLALSPGGLLYRIEAQTGEFERIAHLGISFSGEGDLAFDSDDNLYLSISYAGETHLYRFGPDFTGRTLVGSIPLELTGIVFLGSSLLALSGDTLYEVDSTSLSPSPLVGPFPLNGLVPGSLSLRGLVSSPDGRLFTAGIDSVIIAPPPEPILAELDLEGARLLQLGPIRLQGGLALRMEGCHPDDTTVCSQAGRFAVSVAWNQPGREPLLASPRFITRDSGIFSFLDSDNLEVLVKVLDACAISKHFWVFVSSATSLEHSVSVRDTVTDVVRDYRYGPGLHPPTADTAAFSTCP